MESQQPLAVKYSIHYKVNHVLYASPFIFCGLHDYDSQKSALYAKQLTPLIPS